MAQACKSNKRYPINYTFQFFSCFPPFFDLLFLTGSQYIPLSPSVFPYDLMELPSHVYSGQPTRKISLKMKTYMLETWKITKEKFLLGLGLNSLVPLQHVSLCFYIIYLNTVESRRLNRFSQHIQSLLKKDTLHIIFQRSR